MKKLILASSSPRRMEILRNLGLDFKVIPSGVDENTEEQAPTDVVISLAELKASDVARSAEKDSIIIGADTIVYKNRKIYGKPSSPEEGIVFLRELSGSCHSVMTGLCIIDNNSGKVVRGFEETKVFFKHLTDAEINAYIETGEFFDKAGAYGIQGIGGIFVEKIEGCYSNVVGLPVNKLHNMMMELGLSLIEEVKPIGK